MTHGVEAALVMYVAVACFILFGLVLLGFTVTGTRSTVQRWAQILFLIVWVSAFVALCAALGVIFG